MITSPDIQDENHTRRIIEYNADNMPVRITKGSDVSVVYTYDGHGTRVAKTLNCATTTHYVGSHYETKNGAPVHYIFAGNLRIAMIKNNVRTYFHKDHLGSSTVLTNDAGEVISGQSMVYMPYGSVRSQTDITESAYKFTDQEYGSETGLYNYNARLYDPVIGMFVSADTIVPDPLNPQTFNRYAYCGNNPIMYVDPDGHFLGIDDLIIGIVIGALIGGTSSELQGGDFWDGAISGAISGAIFSGIHFIPGMTNISAGGTIYVQGGGTALSSGTQAAIHFAGGALSGGINAAIKGGDISTGMLIGGIGAGIYGSDFSDGFINGARSAVIAYLCNDMLESLAKLSHNDGKPKDNIYRKVSSPHYKNKSGVNEACNAFKVFLSAGNLPEGDIILFVNDPISNWQAQIIWTAAYPIIAPFYYKGGWGVPKIFPAFTAPD